MELQFEKKCTEYYKSVFSESSIFEESIEMIVTDKSPDILRIVKLCANIFLRDKNMRDGKLDLGGVVKGVVLYVAEGETCIRKLPFSLPFAYVVDCSGASRESFADVHMRLKNLDYREINPRKVSVRVGLCADISVYEKACFELCGEIEKKEEYGLCTKSGELSLYHPIRFLEKSFTISDDIDLSGKCEDLSEILFEKAELDVTDTKVIGKKVIIKGNASISCIYLLEDGRIDCAEHELPFSQIMDVEEMSEDGELKVSLVLNGVELETEYDAAGVARYMTANISATSCVAVYQSENIQVIDDAYSTKYELALERRAEKCTRLVNHTEKRISVTEAIETGTAIGRVLDVAVSINPCTRRPEEGREVLACDAVVSVMYSGDDGEIYNTDRRTNVVCPMALEPTYDYRAQCSVKNKSFSVGASNEINVRFFVDFDISETEGITVPVISEISLDNENVRKKETAPCITVKRLDGERDVWSLAKEYSTTVEEIRLANNLSDNSPLPVGRMVLIPIKR